MVSRKEIRQINSGGEKARLVVGSVMGWKIETDLFKVKRFSQYISPAAPGKWWHTPEGGWTYKSLPHPSDNAAAWQAVEMIGYQSRTLFLVQSATENQVAFDEPRLPPLIIFLSRV